MRLGARPPLADHPVADPRTLLAGGVVGGLVALLTGAAVPVAAATLAALTGGAAIAHRASERRGLVRPWVLGAPWRGEVERAVEAWRSHADTAAAATGPVADRLRREHASMTEILQDLWRIASWGDRQGRLAVDGASELVPEVRAAFAEVQALGRGLVDAARSAAETVALVTRPAAADALYDVEELRQTAQTYRRALGTAAEGAPPE